MMSHLIQNILAQPRLTTLMTQILSPWVTVFMLHRIANPELGITGTSADHLRNCLSYLRKHDYSFISVEDAIDRAMENRLGRKKWVAFSLDDGFAEQVSLGSQLFAEFDCPASCFLITDLVDGKYWPWDYQLMYIAATASARTIRIETNGEMHNIALGTPQTKQSLLYLAKHTAAASIPELIQKIARAAEVDLPQKPPANFRGTTWNDVRAAEKLGMQFGPHSVQHRILSSLDNQSLNDEIVLSTQRLRQECKQPAQVFCYPSGKAHEFDERAIAILRKLNFKGALSAEEGFLDAQKLQQLASYRYAIPRLPLPHSFSAFKRYVSWTQYLRESLNRNPLETIWRHH